MVRPQPGMGGPGLDWWVNRIQDLFYSTFLDEVKIKTVNRDETYHWKIFLKSWRQTFNPRCDSFGFHVKQPKLAFGQDVWKHSHCSQRFGFRVNLQFLEKLSWRSWSALQLGACLRNMKTQQLHRTSCTSVYISAVCVDSKHANNVKVYIWGILKCVLNPTMLTLTLKRS